MKARREVGKAIMKCIYPYYVRPPKELPDLSEQYFSKHLQGCYGCVDGSHFQIVVPTEMKEDYLNRKGGISTNAMLICHCDNSLMFQYANFGAEGNGGDSVILRECAEKDLKFLEGGFLLGDAGYNLSHRVLTPYRKTRYHLKEFSATSPLGRPQNKEELFNLWHAKLRNQVTILLLACLLSVFLLTIVYLFIH